MEKNKFRIRVNRVFDVWEDWSLYNEKFLSGLRAVFNRNKLSNYSGIPLDQIHDLNTFLIKEEEENFKIFKEKLMSLPLNTLESMAKNSGVSRSIPRDHLIDRLSVVHRANIEMEIENFLKIDDSSERESFDRRNIEQVYEMMEEKDFPSGTIQRVLNKKENFNRLISKKAK